MSIFTTNNTENNNRNWPTIAARIPPEDYEKLKKRYPEHGRLSDVVRALIQMHLNGQVNKLEFTFKKSISTPKNI